MIIEGPFLPTNGSIEKITQVNLGDKAIIQREPNSFHEGTVKFISYRGINISTPYGDRFVKWRNVLRVMKETKENLKIFQFIFYNRFACQTQTYKVKAKNKHVARHEFWKRYPKTSYGDCIAFIEEI